MNDERFTAWFPATTNPARSGFYEVRENRPLHRRSRGHLQGGRFRYWTGKTWMTSSPDLSWCFPSIFGTHEAHEWRGLTKRTAKATL